MITSIEPIKRTVHKTHIWIKDFHKESNIKDKKKAFEMLKYFLQTLRDRLTVEEAAQLSAELPALLRGYFYESYEPEKMPERIRTEKDFIKKYFEKAKEEYDYHKLTIAGFRVLKKHIAEGEYEDILSVLPEKIRKLTEERIELVI